MSTGADTKADTIWGGGALQLLQHTVPLDATRDSDDSEHGGERGRLGSAPGSDAVARNTASEGQDWNGEKVGVSMGADTNANSLGWWLTPGW